MYLCASEVVLFHDGVGKADEAQVSLARKTLYPLLFAFHRTNYIQLIARDEGFLQWAKSNDVSQEYLQQRRKAAYVSPSGLGYLHQGDDAFHEEVNRELKSFVPPAPTIRIRTHNHFGLTVVC